MKKIIALMLVAVMMVMALTSCDLIDKLLGKDSGETRYTITAEEWDSLNNITNYTCRNVGSNTMSINGDSATYSSENTVKVTESSYYQNIIGTNYDGEYTREEYHAIKDGVEYSLSKQEDGTYIGLVSQYNNIYSLGKYIGCSAAFEDLTYDEATHAYTVTENQDGVELQYSFYFENGTLVKLVGIGSGEMPVGEGISYHIEVEATMTISDIGTTVIEVPEFTVQ